LKAINSEDIPYKPIEEWQDFCEKIPDIAKKIDVFRSWDCYFASYHGMFFTTESVWENIEYGANCNECLVYYTENYTRFEYAKSVLKNEPYSYVGNENESVYISIKE
jgi:hypothetical protein